MFSCDLLGANLKVDGMVLVNPGGAPKNEDFAALDRLAENIWTANSAKTD